MRDIAVTAYVDPDEVLAEIDTDDLEEELQSRRSKRGGGASQPDCPLVLKLSSWEAESLRLAILRDEGRRVVDILRPIMGEA